ncbi:CUB and sushi domain-containing protein 1 [Orchesella cincta]|uniref:CUB and sushi domain-containing protein 1 n=1 Tax=Orchesella cincta TaxID=48709 RepID=A0A1D2MRG4_ORCCI|nr:CUB and sushi domain-containing protein 1 [Orchesella cincta]
MHGGDCGGVLTETQGLIEYKLNETYNRYERCLWTIRSPYRTKIRLSLLESGMQQRYDNIQIKTFNGSGIRDSFVFTVAPRTVTMVGTVTLVLFTSNLANEGTGFSLSYAVEAEYDNSLLYYEDQHRIMDVVGGDLVRFPESGLYRNLELSTLTFIRPHFNPYETIDMNITSLELEAGVDGQCRDRLHVYVIKEPGTVEPNLNHFFRYTPEDGICQSTDLSPVTPFVRAYGIVLILATDQQGRGNGFEIGIKSPT